MNKVQLIGYLGKDPQFTALKNGNWMVRLRMATDHWFHSKEGNAIKTTQWHTVRVWGKTKVERWRDYLIKGSHIMVEGRLIYYACTNKEGQQTIITEIRASSVVDLDR